MRQAVALFSALCLFVIPVQAAETTDVYLGLQKSVGGTGKSLGLGIASFEPSGAGEVAQLAKSVRSVLREDLLFSRYFEISEGGPTPTADKVDPAWNALGASIVVTGSVSIGNGQLTFQSQLRDVSSGQVILSKQETVPAGAYRKAAHRIADAITFQLSGQPGIADSQIAFINNRTGKKELYVMDYDGYNARQVTSYRSITLLPKWSADGKQVAFNSYKAGNPDAYIYDAGSGSIKQLSGRQGLNTSPSWSPDGQQIALTLSKGGNPDIYLIDENGKLLRRLTYKGVNTSPSFSPNGQQIAFVSGRTGNPELYVTDITGVNVQRLTYGQRVDSPAWSPRGDWIVYQRERSYGQYDICLIDPTGKNNIVLTTGMGRNENPNWSPDGRFIVFSSTREGGKAKLYRMGADGSNPHPIGSLSGQSFQPSWGK